MVHRIISKPALKPADYGWIVLWAWVFAFNIWASKRKSERLSEACDRYLASHRVLTELWLAIFYIHLSNRLSGRYERFDPVHLAKLVVLRSK